VTPYYGVAKRATIGRRYVIRDLYHKRSVFFWITSLGSDEQLTRLLFDPLRLHAFESDAATSDELSDI
jgi:hypothetical protein